MAAAAPSESLSFSKVLSESRRIIRSHKRNFQVLTALFVFPLSVCSILYPIIQTKLQPHQLSELEYSNLQAQPNPYQYLLLSVLYLLFVSIFSFCSIATISYTTYHGFHDEPVDLIESIKSILYSFWPLFSTSLVLYLIAVLMAIPLILLALFVYKWIHSASYNLIIILIVLVFFVLMIYLQMNFILAAAVSVVESKRGYAALKRSAYLIKGNRRVVLKMLLYFGLLNGIFFWGFNGSYWNGWWFLLYIICSSIYLSYMILLSYVAISVLYVYCRDSHEGLLPFQDAKKLPLLK